MINYFFSQLDEIKLNGHKTDRIFNNLNFTIKNVLLQDLIKNIPEIAFSTGSTCLSEGTKTNRILKSIRLSDEEIATSFRIGIGRFNSIEEIKYASEKFINVISSLRKKNKPVRK
jgi:cysteine desulfurase